MNLVIVLVVFFLEQSLVSLGAVRGTWRRGHVTRILLSLALSGFNCNLGVLIEAPEWQNNDLVVQQSAEDQNKEAWDGLPLEGLKSECHASDPDEYRPRRVHC